MKVHVHKVLKALKNAKTTTIMHGCIYLGYYGFAMIEGHWAHKALAGGLFAYNALTLAYEGTH